MRILPPLLWISMLGLIGAAYGIGWGPHLLPESWRWPGIAIVAIGMAVTIAASRQFHRVRTNINTFRAPDTLVTNGLFAISRNPMYLGFCVSLLGAAVFANRLSALAPAALFFLVCQFYYIPFEERAAERVFGEPWRGYARRVRRWI
ncbi:methyltransferase family protein [Chelativorans sp. YIM 93263]|uniref:methyltransferase family protein n=1 Tax=Chelativorans sp. YIM 93263 TaxID=2906648 RepID=UPI0023797885|nr:isoprenylcysteine carboxylmethyltransferase family protein [Chelativorans sp. YIM 93263]